MPQNGNIKESINKYIKDAERELQDYPVMPEHYSTILKHPNLDATGFYSELDFEIGARLKRCDTFIKTKGILENAMYDHVRGEIETKGGDLKKEVIKLSMQHRTLTRAARICTDPEIKEELTKMADSLKNSKAVKDYNHLITSLEYYAGVNEGKQLPRECIEALDSCIGYQTDGQMVKAELSTSERLKTPPSKIKIEFRNMDKFTEQMMQSHPGFREKSEKQKETLGPKDKAFNVTVTHYAKDACKDTLDALAGNLEERMDLLMINGQTLREMIEEKTGNKKPSKEEIENLSCLYVTAALRSEGSVEVFTPYLTSATTKTYRQDPVVIEGSKPKERVTMRFWEIWLSKLGFFKEKLKLYSEQQKMDARREKCRERVRKNLAFNPKTKEEIREAKEAGKKKRVVNNSLTNAEKTEQKARQAIVEKYKDAYVNAVRMREKVRGANDSLLYSFFPEGAQKRAGINLESKVDKAVPQLMRTRPLYYVVAQMLQERYSLKDVLDPTKLGDVRARIGREFRERYEKMTSEEFMKMHVDSMKALAKEMPNMAKEMSRDIKTREDLRENYHKYYVGVMCMNVLHMDHEKRPESVAYCGGEKEYDDLVAKLAEADAFYGLKDSYDALYLEFHKILDGGDVRIANVMENNMKEELILMGLRGKEPHLSPKLFEHNIQTVGLNLQYQPEVIECQKQAEKVNEKLLGDLLKSGTSDSWKLKVEVYEEALKTTKESGMIGVGEKLGLNVSINGKKMLELEEPTLENEKDEMTF